MTGGPDRRWQANSLEQEVAEAADDLLLQISAISASSCSNNSEQTFRW
jgi:hypothetical protein